MAKLNAQNERIKREYFRFLKDARGKSEATLNQARKAIERFETYTQKKDFKTFNREQAIGFKRTLADVCGMRTGETLSPSTQISTLSCLKEFFAWLAWQPGFKSKIHLPDVEYFTPSLKDSATAKAAKLRDFPSLEQIRAVIAKMPVETVLERRNRALVAFTILTGMRDGAIASLSLRHVDVTKNPVLVRQEPDRVKTKFSKSINTYFFPVGDGLGQIVLDWIDELQTDHLFGPADPVFPRTKITRGEGFAFIASGVEAAHWTTASPIRDVFKSAFAVAGLPYFPPHTFRHTLGHLMQKACKTPEEVKAWSQNLGHEELRTTLTSYGTIGPHRQGEVMAMISLEAKPAADDEMLAKIRALVN